MGTYVSESDVRTLMPQFSMVVTASAAYSKTSDIINKAISRAEAITNSYVGCRYSLPFTSTAIPVRVREEALALSVALSHSFICTQESNSRMLTKLKRYSFNPASLIVF